MDPSESEENESREPGKPVSRDQLTKWAESCLRMQHLDDLVQREISASSLPRAKHLAERARRRAWVLFNEMIEAGGSKPPGYCEPDYTGDPFS